jgi:hypothetical protein
VRDNTSRVFPLCSTSRQPIWAGARSDKFTGWLADPRVQNADSIESVMKMTIARGITSDGSGDPSFRLLLLQELRVVAQPTIVIVSISVKVSSSSGDALWWCRGHLWLRRRGGLHPRLHLLLRRGGRVLLLLLLVSTLLLLVQAAMQSL